MRVSITVTKIEYDSRGHKTATYRALRNQMIAAAALFVRVAAPRIPIDTGMARGSFLNMLQLLDRNSDPDGGLGFGAYARDIPDGIPTEAQRRNKNGRYIKYYAKDGSVYQKKPLTAKKFTTSRGQIIKRDGDNLVFKYEVDVVHLDLMDEHNPIGSNWEAMRTGRAAFMAEMQKYKPLDVTKFLLLSTQTNTSSGTLRNQKTVK